MCQRKSQAQCCLAILCHHFAPREGSVEYLAAFIYTQWCDKSCWVCKMPLCFITVVVLQFCSIIYVLCCLGCSNYMSACLRGEKARQMNLLRFIWLWSMLDFGNEVNCLGALCIKYFVHIQQLKGEPQTVHTKHSRWILAIQNLLAISVLKFCIFLFASVECTSIFAKLMVFNFLFSWNLKPFP